jgi:hypothetical protein
VERDPLDAANAKWRKSALVLEPPELALDGSAATVKLAEALCPARDERGGDGSPSPTCSGLERTAKVMTNTELEELLSGRTPEVQEEILRINTDSRPIALQIALLVPLIAAALGLLNGWRMTRLADPKPSSAAEGMLMG